MEFKPTILRLKQIEIPVCLIVGQNDNIVKKIMIILKHQRIFQKQNLTNPENGHLMHEENPELISDQIKSFILKVFAFK